ncbi:unnamed protein product [Rotaria sp. Silwood2]|nr:unnamed protein product [Rotaria sp. Silwood2]CAF4455434.1 unnamed protein product [Rotaria sp. Silwood2]CAF4492748.1 unnamed protein product [Rotaria sp. Silwood2]
MFLLKTTRLIARPSHVWIIIGFQKRNNSTRKLTSSYYHHAAPFPMVYKTLSQSFDAIAEKYSDHECLVFKSQQKRYTYKTFKEEVDNIAASLLDLGFQKNDRFAVWLPNTSENVTISYAASKLGLIKVNINPAYVERELEYCINKVGCKGILLSPSIKSFNTLEIFRRLVPELGQSVSSTNVLSAKTVPTLKHVILTGTQISIPGVHSYEDLIKRGGQLSHKSLIERQASIDPDAPVEIFYTSGTTGQPKAATLTNFGVINLIRSQWEHFGQFFTRLCVPIPMFHIFSEMVGVLNAAVAKCHLTFPDILPDTVSTMRAIHEEKCTALIGAPIIFRDILMHPDRKKYNFTSLVFGLSGANAMHIDFLRQLEKELPITRMAQAYGMTETAGIITCSMWAGDEDVKQRLSSIGRPMQGLEIKVVDQEGNTVSIGKSGEIQTRGHSVMLEYYGDIEKTQETITSSRWLRTGDEGKMNENGYVYFVGRKKDIINRGGVKIYPVEVENTIAEHPCVADAQVFSIPNERYDEEVCAWIRLKPDAPKCEVEDIRNFLKNRLAFFKIPTHIRIVDKFIMTPTGKAQKFKMSEVMANELQQNKNKH